MVLTEDKAIGRNLIVIWFHDKKILQNVLHEIRIESHRNFNYAHFFNDITCLMNYIKRDLVVKNVVFIDINFNEKEGKALKLLVEHRKYQGFYRLPLRKNQFSDLTSINEIRQTVKKWIKEIINELQKNISYERVESTNDNNTLTADSASLFGIVKSISEKIPLHDLSKESLKFFLFQSLIEIMIHNEYDANNFKEMWSLCHEACLEDAAEAQKIRAMAKKYEAGKAIKYYTKQSHLSRLLNRTLRCENFYKIYRFGCYISDLHKQIKELSIKQRQAANKCINPLYRGQKLTTDVIQQLQDNQDHLISLQGLLSTTKTYEVAEMFISSGKPQDDYRDVIFEFNINSDSIDLVRPYADIGEISMCTDEEEILFFMGFVWKLKSIVPPDKNKTIWRIVFETCTDCNDQLKDYLEESTNDKGYLRMGDIVRELGDNASATKFYELMLKRNIPEAVRGQLHYRIGKIAEDEGLDNIAMKNYLLAEKLIKSGAAPDSEEPGVPKYIFPNSIVASLLHIKNNIALINMNNGEEDEARSCFMAALQEKGSDIERALVLNNFALLEFRYQNIQTAKDYLSQAVELAKNDVSYLKFKHNLDQIEAHDVRNNEDTKM